MSKPLSLPKKIDKKLKKLQKVREKLGRLKTPEQARLEEKEKILEGELKVLNHRWDHGHLYNDRMEC